MPPTSQGYLTLAGAWIAAGLPLPADPDDPAWAHLLVEAARAAGWDRPDVLFEGADGPALLAPERLEPRRDAIDHGRASQLPGAWNPGGTMYLCAIDDRRMGVSLIQSNAAGFGSGLAEPATRIFLQNRGLGFNLVAGHPAEYGPGRRPPHTLSPALVTDAAGGLAMTLGTMGGDSQPQLLLQLLARTLHHGQHPAHALAAGRWALSGGEGASGFDCWTSGTQVVQVEGHCAAGWGDGLAAAGHAVQALPAFSSGFGHAHLIRVIEGGGVLEGAADPRSLAGGAVGW